MKIPSRDNKLDIKKRKKIISGSILLHHELGSFSLSHSMIGRKKRHYDAMFRLSSSKLSEYTTPR